MESVSTSSLVAGGLQGIHLIFVVLITLTPFITWDPTVLWSIVVLQTLVLWQWVLIGGCVLNEYDQSPSPNTSILVAKFATLLSLDNPSSPVTLDYAGKIWVWCFSIIPTVVALGKLYISF